jgi:LmbE family N-acetylglucosaminyl deacetylase
MKIPLVFFCLFVFAASPGLAQPDVELQQAFLDLSNDGVVMNISAHPDDEDGAALALYRMRYGCSTVSVLFTRGEGGQNEKGPELYEELGVLRSAETESAGDILGASVQFLNFLDFGYSKTATETFKMWGGQQEALRRLVFVIRKYKPDILFTNHNTIDGHGHHQAAAITAIAAFDAAADSSMFPEQLRRPGVTLWQPRKLFFRAFGRFEPTADVANAIGDTNALRGVSYLEIAARALRQHRTQGMERANLRGFTRGKSLYRTVRMNSLYERDSTNFFGGIDLWRDHFVASLADLRKQIAAIGPDVPRRELLLRISRLAARIDSARQRPPSSPLAQRILAGWSRKLERIVQLACGIELRCRLDDSVIVARQKATVISSLTSTRSGISDVRYALSAPPGWKVGQVAKPATDSAAARVALPVEVGPSPVPTLPRAVAQYGSLEIEEDLICRAAFLADGLPFVLHARVPFDVAPRLTLSLAQSVACVRPEETGKGIRFTYEARNYSPGSVSGAIGLIGPRGWKAESSSYRIATEDGSATGDVVVHPPADVRPGEYTIRFATDGAAASATLHVFDVSAAPGLRVGVVRSYENTLETTLRDLNVEFTLLTERDLESGDLQRWHTIVLDIRAYLVREDLRKNNGRLLEYVRNGGNLVVMYQRDQEWKPEYAPYPFTISRRRITVEDAPVDILEPLHPLMNSPNRITATDWLGWKQERAIYLPSDVSAEYLRLLASHDPDEPEETAGYLVAPYGKGTYLYTSFVWYRQLKEHLPGAVRCFANMISYPLVRK